MPARKKGIPARLARDERQSDEGAQDGPHAIGAPPPPLRPEGMSEQNRVDADDDTRGPAMDRGTPMPGEAAPFPNLDDPGFRARMDSADAISHGRPRGPERIPGFAPRDATSAMPQGGGAAPIHDTPGDVDFNDPLRRGDGDVRAAMGSAPSPRAMLADRAIDRGTNDLHDAIARRAARHRR